MRNQTVTAEELNRHISGLVSSMELINADILSGNVDKDTVDRVDRNYRHINLVLERNYILESGQDLSSFQLAASSGQEFVEANKTIS